MSKHSRKETRRERAYNALREIKTSIKPTPGSDDEHDPAWCLLNTSNDQIELMLVTVLPALEEQVTAQVRKNLSGYEKTSFLFSTWEQNFLKSINAQYEERTLRGYNDQPLSGRQLVYLHALYKRLAADVAAALEMEDDR